MFSTQEQRQGCLVFAGCQGLACSAASLSAPITLQTAAEHLLRARHHARKTRQRPAFRELAASRQDRGDMEFPNNGACVGKTTHLHNSPPCYFNYFLPSPFLHLPKVRVSGIHTVSTVIFGSPVPNMVPTHSKFHKCLLDSNTTVL